MKFAAITGFVLLSASCSFSERHSLENLNERNALDEAVSNLSRGSEIRGAFSGVSQDWLAQNCNVIPRGGGMRTVFSIGDPSWSEFVVVQVSGEIGYKLSISDFMLLIVADPDAEFSGLPKSAKIHMIEWMTVRNGNLLVVNWSVPKFE